MRIGAIEAGGTKMVCAIGDEQGIIEEKIVIPTDTPEITMPKMIEYFRERDIEALGIGCFGPIDLNRQSETYGYITSTPKLDWVNYNIVGTLKDSLKVPVGFDTDVNGAILGEVTWGAARGCEVAIYITVGTGVGVGVYANGNLLHGLMHPEAGHILLQRKEGDGFRSNCPYHENCMEGLASGPAIEVRYGKKAIDLTKRKEVWDLEAYYIGQAITNYILMLSPNKVILWGGVMHQEQLFSLVRKEVKKLLNGYIQNESILHNIDEYIVAPGLGDEPGIKGALKLGELAALSIL